MENVIHKETYSFEEAVDFLKISESVLTEFLTSGMLPAAKLSKGWVIRYQDLADFLREHVELQTALRREAYEAGVSPKVETAFGALLKQKRRRTTPPTAPCRRRGQLPVLPAIPAAASA